MSSPVTFPALLALRNNQLKHILQRCGLLVTGTKKEMANRIMDGILLPSTIYSPPLQTLLQVSHAPRGRSGPRKVQNSPSPSAPAPLLERRILSLDMGIKNFALCLLSVPYRPYLPEQGFPIPQVLAWERYSVIDKYMGGLLIDQGDGVEAKPEVYEDATGMQAEKGKGNTRENRNNKKKKQKEKSALSNRFRPDNFAPIAIQLAQDLLASYTPDVILLETQRARTLGGSAVQEWTLRVNMLEQMLHAILKLSELNKSWHGGTILSVGPKQVASYWSESEGSTAMKKASSKPFKTSIVRSWLPGNATFKSPIELDESLDELAKGFTARRGNQIKLDDLADSLLQGVTYVMWEHNRARLREGNLQLDGD